MANLFKIEVLTPDVKLLETQAVSVFIPAQDGEVEILAQHCDFIGVLGQGVLKVNAENEVHEFAVSKGLFQVLDGELNVLSDKISTPKNITLELVNIKIDKVNQKLAAEGTTQDEIQFLKDELQYALAQRKILGAE